MGFTAHQNLTHRPGAVVLPSFVACSLALHGAAFAVISSAATRQDRPDSLLPSPMELVMFEVEPPKPPAPEEPQPVTKPKPKLPPIKIAEAKKPPPKEDAPPPPNDPPVETPPPKVPLVVGMTMSSTTTGGAFAAPVGNTLYGKSADKATVPSDVKQYTAPKFIPIYQVDSEPLVLSELKIPYPEIARREGIEGTVTLSIVVDAQGKVVSAKVLAGPGHGLDEAARDAIGKFRFKPAIKAGEPVSTEMKYRYTFFLD